MRKREAPVLTEPRRLIVYTRTDDNLADMIEHARTWRWEIDAGCLLVMDGVGTHYYPLTSVARFTLVHELEDGYAVIPGVSASA